MHVHTSFLPREVHVLGDLGYKQMCDMPFKFVCKMREPVARRIYTATYLTHRGLYGIAKPSLLPIKRW